jgi:hypothetical protein
MNANNMFTPVRDLFINGGAMEAAGVHYLVFDGDKIGDHLASAYLSNDERVLSEIDTALRERLANAAGFLRSLGFVMIACGADGITCKGKIVNLKASFCELARIVAPYTFSMGCGNSLRDAYVSLRFAKANGRNRYARMTTDGFIELAPTMTVQSAP